MNLLRIDSHTGLLPRSSKDRHLPDRLDIRLRHHRSFSAGAVEHRQVVEGMRRKVVVAGVGNLVGVHRVGGNILLAVVVGRIGVVEALCCSNRWQT